MRSSKLYRAKIGNYWLKHLGTEECYSLVLSDRELDAAFYNEEEAHALVAEFNAVIY